MSRIGKIPITIPQGVKVEVADQVVRVEGVKGKLAQEFLPNIEIRVDGQTCVVTRVNDSKLSRSLHGLYRNLLSNMIVGVSSGFTNASASTSVPVFKCVSKISLIWL